ncbi:MAG TPA: CARDB domain-containing protein [Solirubrobacteraceae bacterium]|nr:CARDB domain-containing protein [Solirubrobacteraceae bacterium]
MRSTSLTRVFTLFVVAVVVDLSLASVGIARRASTQPSVTGTSGQLTGTSETLTVGQAVNPRQIHPEDPNPELESERERQPADPPDKPYKPTEGPTSDGTTGAGGFAPLKMFRNAVSQPVAGGAVQEPTAANGGNVILATGNTWATLSSDDGQTWPATLALNPGKKPAKGDFACCDQLAYSVERGGHTLFFWLIQDDCAGIACGVGNPTKENALTIRVFQNQQKLLAGQACQIVLRPSQFPAIKKTAWFDFNKISSTNKFLYLSTDVHTLKGTSLGVEIFRFPLDKLDEMHHGHCKPPRHMAWHLPNANSMAPVEHASSTMYFAEHINNSAKGDELRIYSVDDGSTKLSNVDRDVNNFAPNTRGAGRCPSPDGDDPCKRFNSNQTVGFRSGNTVGWLWTAPQDSQFAFPQVRVAVFRTGSLKSVTEHAIYSPVFAWTYPAVGVNSRGDVGVIVYSMGGGQFPSPHAFIVKDPSNWSSIGLHKLATGVASMPGKTTPTANVWGDYASVHAYAGCPNTFLATAWSIQKSGARSVSEDRVAWFGDPKDGCADLAVTGAIAAPGRLAVGGTLSIVDVAKNLGSGSSAATETRYYLSKDATKSPGDVLIKGGTAVPALVPDGQFSPTHATSLTIPTIAPGTYHLLACANDVIPIVAETTLGNNCFSNQSITVS